MGPLHPSHMLCDYLLILAKVNVSWDDLGWESFSEKNHLLPAEHAVELADDALLDDGFVEDALVNSQVVP